MSSGDAAAKAFNGMLEISRAKLRDLEAGHENAAHVYRVVGRDYGDNKGGFQFLGCESMKT